MRPIPWVTLSQDDLYDEVGQGWPVSRATELRATLCHHHGPALAQGPEILGSLACLFL